jgi:hypothetical protein
MRLHQFRPLFFSEALTKLPTSINDQSIAQHLVSIVLVHMFCNTLGLPSIEFMNPRGRLYSTRYRKYLKACAMHLFLLHMYRNKGIDLQTHVTA